MKVFDVPRFFRIGCIGLLALLITACGGSRGGSIPYEVQNFGTPDAPRAAVLPADYQITTGDTLTITVFGVESLSKEYEVDLAGNIAMPLIGNVPVIGQTTEQLRTEVARRLGERYLQNPDVTVAVTESAGRNVTVEGSVNQPGVYPVTGPTTLLQAVALARGTNNDSNPRRVAIFRQVQGQRMAAAFDLISIRRGEMEDPTVYAGDIVVVDGSSTRGMFRDVLAVLPVVALFRPY